METRSIHFKSDFLVRLVNEVDWSTPFSIRFFTTRAVSAKVVAFDGENYVGCTLDESTGALLVPFERFTEIYRQGLGTLRMELTYRLSNALYPDQYQDVVLPAQPVVCTNDDDEQFYLSLALTGDDDVEVSASVVAPFMTGPQGEQGEQGVGISTMVQTSASVASAGANVWKMTLTDGREFSFTVLNGKKGDTGATGPQGPQGAKGEKGDKGDTGARGPQGEQGPRGVPGQRGEKGAKGDKGDRGLTGETGPAGNTPEIGQNGNWWIGGIDTGVKADYSGTEAQRQATFEANEADRQEEFNSKEATRDAANQAALDCAETLAALGPKLAHVEAENADSEDEQQIWSNDAGTDEYAKIDANGVWGKNLKYQDGASVKDVKTELAGKMPNKTIDSTPTTGSNNLVSSGGVKQAIDEASRYKDITEDVSDSSVDKIEITDDNGKTYSTIEIDESTANEDEQIWGNDEGTDIYAKINSQGIHAKKFFTLDGQEIGGGQVIPNLIVVDAAGNGDYTSLVDALNNAGDTQTKHVTILVMAGTYEMPPKVSYNAPYVESNRNLTIKGVNRNKCILTCNIGFYDYTIGTDCATLRLTGNVTIENLTIISSNEQYDSKVGTEGYVTTRTGRKAAYSIHLDQGRRVGDVVLVKDCTIINKQMSCIGFGLREDSTIRVENCDLVCEQAAADSEANDYGTIWGHNASGQDVGGQRLEIINNRITHKTGRYAVRLSYAGNGTTDYLEVSYLLVGNAVNTTNLAQSLLVNGFPEGTCTHDAMSFGNQAETMNINN